MYLQTKSDLPNITKKTAVQKHFKHFSPFSYWQSIYIPISAIPIFLQTSGWCLYKAVFFTFPHLLTGKVREYLYTYIRNAIMKQNL